MSSNADSHHASRVPMWVELSSKLFFATWPVALTIIVGSGVSFGVYVNRSLGEHRERIAALEQWGPKSSPMFTSVDAERLRLQVLQEADARDKAVAAIASDRMVAIMTKLEMLQRSVIELKIRSEMGGVSRARPSGETEDDFDQMNGSGK